MKKFVAVFDGYKMSQSTLDYAIWLCQVCNAHLVGVFLDEFIYLDYDVVTVMKTYKNFEEARKILDAKGKKARDQSVRQFELACGKAKLAYTVHRDTNIAISDLKAESIFADLIIINESETFTRYKEKSPTRFMRELLADVQCPVLAVPNLFKPVKKILLLYDGSPSSVFAARMFHHLLGNLESIPVEVYCVIDSTHRLQLPHNKLMREFMKWHFPKVEYVVKRGDANESISGRLKQSRDNELVVLGAYRRTDISRFFRKSMADVLMKTFDKPMFIAHNR